MKIGIRKITAGLLAVASMLVTFAAFAPNKVLADGPAALYQTHVQNVGWQDSVWNGETAGTEGSGLRMEAVKILIANDPELGVRYKAHVENQGWDADWFYDGATAGTVGAGLRIEALQIELTGNDAANYDIYYSLHVQNLGWLGWACNGQVAGTTGCALRVEAIKVIVLPKGSEAPATDSTLPACPSDVVHVSYSSHVQDIGWTWFVGDGATSGSTGAGRRLEGIRIEVSGADDIGIRYRTHIQNIGWDPEWRYNGEVSGTEGQGLRIEAIQIELTGADSANYDVWYRSHVENYGWLGWAKNGEYSGTSSCGYRMEAVEIRVLPKGAEPGSTAGAFVSTPLFTDSMDVMAQNYTSPTPYLILINKSTFTVAIYRNDNGHWYRIDSFGCTIGAPGHDTIEGVFHVQGRTYYFDSYGVRCFYATGFCGDYMIHSTLYNKLPRPTSPCDTRIGQALSHGCVRVELANAEWIYNNIPGGTTVVVYH
ncbi:MAG: L,D-transpeptidase family protein [Saccharofermentans sp.]|nr:L,D-transpeptidase family protein [Saccharofermentans sp.]